MQAFQTCERMNALRASNERDDIDTDFHMYATRLSLNTIGGLIHRSPRW